MFRSDSYPRGDRLAWLLPVRESGAPLVWRTDLDPDVLANRVAEMLHDRLGSWSSGREFQVATTSDPWARVLSGRIDVTPEGSMVTATLCARTDIRDIMSFGAIMLWVTVGLLTACCVAQLEGREMLISLTAVALAGVVAWGSALALHAWFFGRARAADDVYLGMALRQILRDVST